ncbi:MAG: NAD(P)H-dependent oxidoreductase [Rhodospirillales bacterium]|nr:NAD(P)H-dependent oxidoreductase [Rhodospirillales bacterium]
MSNILIICGAQKTYISEGRFNRSLVAEAQSALGGTHTVRVTMVEDGYEVDEEQQKWLWADAVILQFPVFWFACPSILKAYMDSVYMRKVFYDKASPYGTGGLLGGKTYMLSSTWNAPDEAFNDPDTFYGGLDVDEALIAMHKAQQYIGMEPLPSFSVHNVIGNPDFETQRGRFLGHLDDVFGG